MYRLAKAGNQVLFMETTGLRNIRPADWKRALARLKAALGFRARSQQPHPNLTIYSPLVLPFPHSRLANTLNKRIVFRAVDAWLRRVGLGDPLVWAFLASPMTLALIEHVRPRLVVYQCMGDATASLPIAGIGRAARELMRRSNLAFANSLPLLDHVRQFVPRAYLFRAGVDVEEFEGIAAEAKAPPPELAGFTGPVAGYVGSIHRWLDLELLAAAARELPAWQFVMIGPILRDVSRLRGLANIHWLGQRPHHELPKYIRYFDVGLIPYVLDQYTASAYPGKLNEYLALGKPVVSTPLPELVAYNREFGDVVNLASGGTEFAGAIRSSQAALTEEQSRRYREVARQNSWAKILERMCELIEEEAPVTVR